MKLETFKFEKEHDLAIFKALKRLAKDASLFDSRFLDILRRKNNNLIDECYKSRHSHGGEETNVNYIYWITDINILPNFSLLSFAWSLNVLKIVGGKKLSYNFKSIFENRFNDAVRELLLKNREKNEIKYLMDNFDLFECLPKNKTLGFNKNHVNTFKYLMENEVGDLPL